MILTGRSVVVVIDDDPIAICGGDDDGGRGTTDKAWVSVRMKIANNFYSWREKWFSI